MHVGTGEGAGFCPVADEPVYHKVGVLYGITPAVNSETLKEVGVFENIPDHVGLITVPVKRDLTGAEDG